MAAVDKACPFCMINQSDKCRVTCMELKLQDIREAVKAARRFEAEPEEDSIRYEEYELGSLTDATILDRIDDILRG